MLKKFFIFLVIDQITKVIFTSRDFFLGPLKVLLIKNYGLPFGIKTANATSLIIVGACFLVFLIYSFFYHRGLSKKQSLGLALLLSGAASNILDRIFFGYVRDFFDLGLGFVFNLADAFIVLGILILLFSRKKRFA
jgi:signal peptidase II